MLYSHSITMRCGRQIASSGADEPISQWTQRPPKSGTSRRRWGEAGSRSVLHVGSQEKEARRCSGKRIGTAIVGRSNRRGFPAVQSWSRSGCTAFARRVVRADRDVNTARHQEHGRAKQDRPHFRSHAAILLTTRMRELRHAFKAHSSGSSNRPSRSDGDERGMRDAHSLQTRRRESNHAGVITKNRSAAPIWTRFMQGCGVRSEVV
jgi:hypothetical protein